MSEPSTENTPREPHPMPKPFGPSFIWTLIAIGGFGLLMLAIPIGVAWQMGLFHSNSDDIAAYRKLRGIMDDILAEREKASPNFDAIRSRATLVGQEIATEMKKEATRYYPAKQCLLWVARDDLPRMLRDDLSTESEAEQHFLERLNEAARELRQPVK